MVLHRRHGRGFGNLRRGQSPRVDFVSITDEERELDVYLQAGHIRLACSNDADIGVIHTDANAGRTPRRDAI